MAQAVTGSDKKDMILVAAIDFGTTYSGYAYSFKSDYEKDPTNVSMNQNWVAGTTSLISQKAPTCVLFDPKKKFHSFGYEAENAYNRLTLDKKHHDYYFFRRFKMKLHEKVTRDIVIEDELGRPMAANIVFSEAIRYMKAHLLESLRKHGTDIKNKDIHWVLTVPAIWTDSAKQFMREATYESGIDGGQLSIALEPEAASLYCQLLPTNKTQGSKGAQFTVAGPGSKYMVVDLGGGTADITVHERQKDGGLRELHKASGGAWGGLNIDEEFNQLVIKLVGAVVWKKFCDANKYDHMDLQRELEIKKRTITPGMRDLVTMKVSYKIDLSYTRETGETIEEAINQSPFKGKIQWSEDKMRINADIFKGLFKKCSDNIVNHIKMLLTQEDVKGTNTLLLVGGFSESPMIQEAIEKAFPQTRVIIPADAGLTVLRGAVIFGHRPVAITSRRSKYTYGINISPPFDPSVHPENKRITVHGMDRCRDVFKKYIEEGQDVLVGDAKSGKHISIKPGEREMLLKIFTSPHRNPAFTDDINCECIGRVIVALPESKEKIYVDVKMLFGETELTVEAQERAEYQTFRAYFDFL